MAMKLLCMIFFCMAAYGICQGMYGAAMISVAMGLFVIYADREFKRQDSRGN